MGVPMGLGVFFVGLAFLALAALDRVDSGGRDKRAPDLDGAALYRRVRSREIALLDLTDAQHQALESYLERQTGRSYRPTL